MAKEVVISNSRLNDYGFRILTQGIDISQYEKNPILLWGHHRTWRGTEDEVLPIGRIENLRIDGDNLIGTPIFDENDPFAKKIQSKWEGGFLKMVSPSVEFIEWSESPEHVVQGQTRATVTKCKLIEVSIVDIGANDDALVLFYQNKKIDLSNNSQPDLDFLNLSKQNNNNQTQSRMEKLFLELGLPSSATEEQAVAKLQELKKENESLKSDKEKISLKAITDSVDAAIADNKISAEKKEHFISLGKTVGLESLTQTLSCMNKPMKPADIVNLGGASSSSKEKAKLSQCSAETIEQLKKEDTAKYVELFEAEYGFKPEL